MPGEANGIRLALQAAILKKRVVRVVVRSGDRFSGIPMSMDDTVVTLSYIGATDERPSREIVVRVDAILVVIAE